MSVMRTSTEADGETQMVGVTKVMIGCGEGEKRSVRGFPSVWLGDHMHIIPVSKERKLSG